MSGTPHVRQFPHRCRAALVIAFSVAVAACATLRAVPPTLVLPMSTSTRLPPATQTLSTTPPQAATQSPSPPATMTPRGSLPIIPGAVIEAGIASELALLASVPLEAGQADWSPDGRYLAVGTRSTVVVFSPLTDAVSRVFSGPEGWDNPSPAFGAVSFSPDGTQLAGGFTVVVAVWDAVSGDLVTEYHNISGEVTSVAYSPNGRWIAASGMRGGFVSRTSTTVPIFWIDSSPEVTWSVAFGPDSRLLASAGPVGIDIWDPSRGSLLREIVGGGGFQLAFATNSILADGENLWNAADGSLVRTLTLDTDAHQVSLAIQPGGSLIAVGFDDGSIQVFDTGSGMAVSRFLAHQGIVRGLAFSPDGRLLVSTGSDDAVRFWGLSSAS